MIGNSFAQSPEWGHLDFVDIPKYLEGEFVGIIWDRPFDWAIEDPYLIGDPKPWQLFPPT